MAEYKFKWDMDKQLYVARVEGEKFAIVRDNAGGHYRIVDAVTFENIVDEEFNEIEPFNRFGYAKFKDKNEKVGLFDKNFERHLYDTYAEIKDFNEDGFAIVGASFDSRQKGVIDANLNEVLPCNYHDLCGYDSKLKHIRGLSNTQDYVLCDLNSGKEISERFDEDFKFDEETGVAVVYQKGKGDGLMNEYGKIVLPCGYYRINHFNGENFYFLTNYQDKKGIATSEGKIIVPCEYTDIEMLSKEGVFAVGNGDIYSLVDANGQKILPYGFDFVMKGKEKGIYKIERIDNGQKLYLTAEGKEIPTKLYRKKQLKNLLLKCVGKEQEKEM